MTIELINEHTWLCNTGKKLNVRNALFDPRSDAIVAVTSSSLLLGRLRRDTGTVAQAGSLMVWI
jgi:hypothetical protein